MTPDEYAEQLLALLPQGKAWPRNEDTKLRRLMRGIGGEFSRVDQRADDLLREVMPSTTVALLRTWEEAAGLPDTCVATGQTLQERRSALLARLTSSGGQSRPFFVALALYLGFSITITEFREFRVDSSAVGEALCGEEWVHTWRVNAPAETIIEFRVDSSAVEEPLRKWGNELLECVFIRLKPAHTFVQFGYGA